MSPLSIKVFPGRPQNIQFYYNGAGKTLRFLACCEDQINSKSLYFQSISPNT